MEYNLTDAWFVTHPRAAGGFAMDKRWYPTAMTVVLIGCSGNGYAVYGPAPATGGNTATLSSTGLTGGSPSIDGGTPSTTGGGNSMGGMQTMYGPALMGGSSAAGGSAAMGGKSPSGAGGATNIDTGTPSTGGRGVIALYGVRQSGGNLGTDS